MLTTSSEVVLPHLWQKPAFDELVGCLRELRVEQPVWGAKVSRDEILKEQSEAFAAHNRREIVSFLSSIIKSSLAWIDVDDEREMIWDEASKRMSERCGRTGTYPAWARRCLGFSADDDGYWLAMGEIIRKWPFEDEICGSFSLTIREPPLIGDSLGLKTWGSSYVLAQLLPQFSAGPLAHLFHNDTVADPGPIEVLELGSGTALLGIAAACLWRTNVMLTDLPNIIPNVTHNANLNRQTVKLHGGHVDAAPLTWGGEEDESDIRFKTMNKYKVRKHNFVEYHLRRSFSDCPIF